MHNIKIVKENELKVYQVNLFNVEKEKKSETSICRKYVISRVVNMNTDISIYLTKKKVIYSIFLYRGFFEYVFIYLYLLLILL